MDRNSKMISLKQISFLIAILGISILFIVLDVQKPLPLTSPDKLDSLTENQLVQISGKVIRQNNYYITLENNLSILCDSCPQYKGKNITVEGTISFYKNQVQINVLKIKSL